jgi:hypothetical protein
MRSSLCWILTFAVALIALGCGDSKEAKGPTAEQQKSIDDDMKKLVNKANKKR